MIKIHRLFYSKIPFLYCSIFERKEIKMKKREAEIQTHGLLICSHMRSQLCQTD